jgi:hypothetical protein
MATASGNKNNNKTNFVIGVASVVQRQRRITHTRERWTQTMYSSCPAAAPQANHDKWEWVTVSS